MCAAEWPEDPGPARCPVRLCPVRDCRCHSGFPWRLNRSSSIPVPEKVLRPA